MNDTPETNRHTGLMYSACNLIETSRRMERERNAKKVLAGELIAAIRINVLHGTFEKATIEQVDEWLKPFVERLNA